MKVFKDLKVVELANVLAGPLVGTFFAELGAKVVKIENKAAGGDLTRHWKVTGEKGRVSAYYASANYGKRSLLLDLTKKGDQKKVYELLKSADVVISNYKAGDAKKLGMEPSRLLKLNPSLICATVTGFGKNDKRTAYDLVLQAETGYMSMNGTEESGPLKMPVALIDVLAAHQLKEAVLIALLQRQRTGKGGVVSVSLYDAAVASLANQASNWLMAKHLPKRNGSKHPNIAPYGESFLTKDKQHIVLAIGTDKQFRELCTALKADALASKKNYCDNPSRVANRLQLEKELRPHFMRQGSRQLMNTFMNRKIPAALIRNVAQVLENPSNKRLILHKKTDGTKRVRTAIFGLSLKT